MNNKLLNAILAMDSYNRGYNEGISLDKSQNNDSLGLTIGNYTVLKESDIADQSEGVLAGFYGIAYENTNTQSPDYEDVIVSYRGTGIRVYGQLCY